MKAAKKTTKPSLKQRYVIVRTYSAGVFAGYLVSRKGKEVVLRDARRIWYWTGAATLSELAMRGTKSPGTCKFPCSVASIELTEAIAAFDALAIPAPGAGAKP